MQYCPKCASERIMKNGRHLERQRFRCKDCGFQFTRDTPRGRPATEKAMAILRYTLGLSFNAIARIYGVATSTVMRWVRDFAEKTYEKPSPWGSCHHRTWWDVALFAFKKNKLWLWKAYCRDTGQLIDWECSNRDQSTLARLMARLRRWSVWFFCTDNWKVYPREIPEDDLIQGKRGTVRIERNNARQRHWFARFKRKSQVVSRSLRMVDLTISLFARFHVNGQREDILSFF